MTHFRLLLALALSALLIGCRDAVTNTGVPPPHVLVSRPDTMCHELLRDGSHRVLRSFAVNSVWRGAPPERAIVNIDRVDIQVYRIAFSQDTTIIEFYSNYLMGEGFGLRPPPSGIIYKSGSIVGIISGNHLSYYPDSLVTSWSNL